LNSIVLIGLFLAGFVYWFNFQAVKEIALRATRAHCRAMEVQMLDDYIAANGIWLSRDKHGKWQIQRTFLFEFSSTGADRYNGKITMLGQRVETIYMEPYRINLN